MEKIADQLARLQRTVPKRDPRTGFLFKSREQLKRRYKQVTFHTVIVSDENTHMIHSARFKSELSRTPTEWRDWFASLPNEENPQFKKKIEQIYAKGILPGIGIRTAKSWGVQKWLGFSGVSLDLHKPKNPKVDRKRHKTKSQRGTRG